jgi:hypothetical protein
MKTKLAVIIINYKTPTLVMDCLDKLLPELLTINAKTIVVDNASGDDSCNLISDWINRNQASEQVELIASEFNSGFSGGNNTGIQHIDADYYLLLNSDTLVRQGSVKTLLSIAEQDESIGIISPRLEWPDQTPQESCFNYHTAISELISSASSGPITKLFKNYIVAQPVKEKVGFYEWTSFACVLVRADVFEQIGLLDDGYFMYYEDVEFCNRLNKAGWRILNVPSARVVHLRGGSSSVKSQAKARKRLPKYYYESRTRYFYQSYGAIGLLAANLCWSLGWMIASIRTLCSSSFDSGISEGQWRDIWTNFFNPLKPYTHPSLYDKT